MILIPAPGAPSFLSNHKYNYAVEGVVSVFLTGADKQETNVKLSGQATVSALGNCGYVLRVPNLQISGPDGKVSKSTIIYVLYVDLKEDIEQRGCLLE